MFFGIATGFWVGMAVTTLVVVIGCAVAWMLPPKVVAAREEEIVELPYSTGHTS